MPSQAAVSAAYAGCGSEQGAVLAGCFHRSRMIVPGSWCLAPRRKTASSRGYHAFGRGLTALELLPDLLRNLEWVPERMRAALEPSMSATDLAVELAREGLPFREACHQMSRCLIIQSLPSELGKSDDTSLCPSGRSVGTD